MFQGFWVDFEAEGPAQVAMRFENDEERSTQLSALTEICGNTRLSQHYLSLARDLDVMEAKLPEEVHHVSHSKLACMLVWSASLHACLPQLLVSARQA